MADLRAASDRSLLVTFAEEPSAAIAGLMRNLEGLPGILNLHPAYASVLVEFDPRLHSHAEIESLVRRRTDDRFLSSVSVSPPRLVEIPVHYGGLYGPDLADVARHAGLSPERVVEIHSSAAYLVHFLGFSPGFPYLGGLPPALATPRLEVPRKLVPAGSVAIGGRQTGVYPMASPGGWRIIGRTPLRLFEPGADPPVLLQMGDHVRFVVKGSI